MARSSKKSASGLIGKILSAFISGAAGYGVAAVARKVAGMVVKDPATQPYAQFGGTLVATGALAYLSAKKGKKGKGGKMGPAGLDMMMVTAGAGVGAAGSLLELPQLAGVKMQLNQSLLAGDNEYTIPISSPEDAMQVARAIASAQRGTMRGGNSNPLRGISFAGNMAFAGNNTNPLSGGSSRDERMAYAM